MPGFYIDIYDAQGNKTNDTAVHVSNVRITERVNRIGEIAFTLPALIARDAGLTKGKRYRVYHETLGYLGQFFHDDIEVDPENRAAVIRALDSLALLADICVGFNWAYSDAPATAVINELCQHAGWTVSYETGVLLGNVTIEFAGESVLSALDAVRYATRGYFRRAGDTAIKFGKFANLGATWSEYGGFTYGGGSYKGDLTAIPAETRAWLVNPAIAGAPTAGLNYATIIQLRRQQRGSAVVNRVIPVGAGQGQTQIDLRYSTRTAPYTIKSRLNRDGRTRTYYIEDEVSIAQYGAIERMLPFSDVRPITNSYGDLVAAANAVYDMAVAYLQRFKAPQEVYTVSCVDLPLDAQPGEIVVVQFYGVMETETGARAFLSLENAPFYITERVIDFGETGKPTYDLTISTSGEATATVIDVFSNVLKDIDKFKVRPTPSQTYYCKTGPTQFIAPLKNAVVKVWIGPEVLYVNELRVECVVAPLRAQFSIGPGGGETITTSNAGGETLWTTSGGSARYSSNAGGGSVLFTEYAVQVALNPHAHVINIPAHTHEIVFPAHQHIVALPVHAHALTVPAHTHAQDWGVVEDSSTISNLSVWLDGVQVAQIVNAETKQPMGPSVSAYGTYEADLMPILEALGDYRSRMHILEFRLMGGRAQIWAQVVGRITIQPIAV